MTKYLSWLFIGALALIAAVSYAHASLINTEPRVMSGVFCTTPEDIKTVLDNRALDMGAIDLVNQDSVKCVLHDGNTSAAVVSSLRFMRADTFDGDKLYLYEATIEGFFIGHVGHKVEPLKQYIYLFEPVDASHKLSDA
jgi:hypothetical protein